ncbi:ComF operon protein A, DNA transporter ATPase [Pediococcus damnosus]|uniref:DEAD/DEAH box helicase n=1 Tax=Pediococcus damnosus TaxID=51663 RepID=UPI00078EB81B|nr:DNA/RNA helicase [Pediococcus damnosus]AMV60049.1 ComF operon protein A, DNA transporter ATPase [Pediococcus damnosus]AMV64293.1 ComF operon protein A, DNA transporter ATPase [Pediococcus damnosus]
MDKSEFFGRLVLMPRDWTNLETSFKKLPTMQIAETRVRCLRCHTWHDKQVAALPRNEFYCSACIQLGRVSTLENFVTLEEPNQFEILDTYLTWQGELTPSQKRCSEEVLRAFNLSQDHLLWAVTGAGKTEMLFPGINDALQTGKRVCLASPRVDVCLELFPRLQAAFQDVDIALLHGHQTDPYHYAQLTIATTHQLLRFYHAFDVLIIDEVDAFPYAQNAQLLYATKQAKKQTGMCLYLTATPGDILLKKVRQKQLGVSYLPQRFHGFPLPEIKTKLVFNWWKKVKNKRLPKALKTFLTNCQQAKRQFLVFVPHINQLAVVLKAINKEFPDLKLTTVFSADEHRLEKVQLMRDGRIAGLITTTILERGVTFPKIDVCVLGADDGTFSSSALVQIAGRVGRNPKRPTGTVLFICNGISRSIKQAQRQIKFVNHKAKEDAYAVSNLS